MVDREHLPVVRGRIVPALAERPGAPMRSLAATPTRERDEVAFDAVPLGDLGGLGELDLTGSAEILTLYDLIIVAGGSGRAELAGRSLALERGLVLFGRPGDIRRLECTALEGARLRFAAIFVGDALGGGELLHQFRCLAPDRKRTATHLGDSDLERIFRLVARVTAKAAAQSPEGFVGLRLALEETLAELDRAYRAGPAGPADPADHAAAPPPDPLGRFLAAVERDLGHGRTIEEYAAEIGLSANRLSALCREQLGLSAAKWIRRRIALEAGRLLIHTDLPSGKVGERLGFDDSGYFVRFVQRETKRTPSAIRARADRRDQAT